MSDILNSLRTALGAAVITDPAALDAVRSDKSGARSGGRPLALVEAGSVADVQTTMRIAHENRTFVVIRGAGTGLAAGANGDSGEIVLSTAKMNRILEVSVADELAVVEPGIINARLDEELSVHGLWWPPDPASKAISSVGGNIATNAGGLLCAKYGVTRDWVLGLTVVLADGTLLRVGHRTVKGVTGYDVTGLMVGSEGTLGVIVEAVLKLRPLPTGGVATIGAYFPDIVAAAEASAAITAAGIKPAAQELLDALSLRLIDAHLSGTGTHVPIAGRGGAYLLVQTDGAAAATEADHVVALLRERGADLEMTTDPVEGERLMQVRRSAHPSYEAAGQVLIEDVSVPRSRLPEMFAEIERISTETGISIPVIAHAGDGNLHPNLIVPPELSTGAEVPEVVWAAADDLFRSAMRLGGTLTGEHGVGILKRRWLEDELGGAGLSLQEGIKRVFDPLGILAPGRMFVPVTSVADGAEAPPQPGDRVEQGRM